MKNIFYIIFIFAGLLIQSCISNYPQEEKTNENKVPVNLEDVPIAGTPLGDAVEAAQRAQSTQDNEKKAAIQKAIADSIKALQQSKSAIEEQKKIFNSPH